MSDLDVVAGGDSWQSRTVSPTGELAGDYGRWVSEADVLDPITVTVDCALGETGCTGPDFAGNMVAQADDPAVVGFVCPSCVRVSGLVWEEWNCWVRGW
jgi:hypothetical protein